MLTTIQLLAQDPDGITFSDPLVVRQDRHPGSSQLSRTLFFPRRRHAASLTPESLTLTGLIHIRTLLLAMGLSQELGETHAVRHAKGNKRHRHQRQQRHSGTSNFFCPDLQFSLSIVILFCLNAAIYACEWLTLLCKSFFVLRHLPLFSHWGGGYCLILRTSVHLPA